MAHPQPALHLVAPAGPPLRADHNAIAFMIHEGARVLDVGCDDGALMSLLARTRGALVRGFDPDPAKVRLSVNRGLAAVQAYADLHLQDLPSAGYDYVVFAQSLQRLRRPDAALRHAARIGERVIVSITNYGHWRARLELFAHGRQPPAPGAAAAPWFSDDNLRRCSVRDLAELARASRLHIERAIPLSRGEPGAPFAKTLWRANWFAESAVFLLGQ